MNISTFINPSGATVWRVSGMLDGKQRRQNVKTEAEALTLKQNWEREAANLEPLPAITTRLTSAQAEEAEHAFKRLQGSPLTLTQAIDYALANYTPSLKQSTVNAAFELFLEDKRAQNLREATLTKYESKCGRLKREHGTKLVNEITPEQVRALVFRKGTGAVNHDTIRRALTCFFNWCVEKEYCESSPVDKVPVITLERDEPEILTLDQVRNLLAAAATFKDGKLLPYVVLALFGGIRPTEITRLTWADVDLEERTVTVGAKIAKMRARRIVELQPNAVAFLAPLAISKPAFVQANWTRDFNAVKALAKINAWPQDIMRHTAISMHLAKWKHEGETATWAGNSPDMIQRHYKGLVKQADANAFWQIAPDGQGGVIDLPTPTPKAEQQPQPKVSEA